MDHFIVDLRGVDGANLGDEVELLSRELTGDLSVVEIAKRWGTNEYDVLANIGSRVGRKLVD
jgi:alanine racemase